MKIESTFDLSNIITTFGNIDSDDYDIDPVAHYTEGQCYVLATAFWLKYGYSIRILKEPKGIGYWGHVVNLLPDGRTVDIMGISTMEDVLEVWREEFNAAHLPTVVEVNLDPDDPGEFWSEEGWTRRRWFEDQLDLAIEVVQELQRQILTPSPNP